jgi:hypothetical protein
VNTYETAKVTAGQMRTIYDAASKRMEELHPRYLAWAKELDRVADEEDKKERAERAERLKKELEASEAARKKYEREVFEWESKCSWFRGERPSYPILHLISGGWYLPSFYPRHRYSWDVEEVTTELERAKRDAWSGPEVFDMTQPQIARMLAWADGSIFDGIEKRMASKEPVDAPL